MGRYFRRLLVVIGLWSLLSHTAQAATITVTTTADSGVGSLRQALVDAANGDTIGFAAALSGASITLSSGPLAVAKRVTIDGTTPGMAISLSGNQAQAILSISNSAFVTVTRLTLAHGKGNYGGAIFNGGTLTLNQVTVANNSALSGGAIYNVGTLTLLNSTISGNSAFSGGGIDNYGTLTLRHNTFSRNNATNTGGGLYNAGTLALYNTILADSNGGGDCHNANDPFFNLVGVIAANVGTLTEDGSCGAALSGDPKLAALALLNGRLVHLPATDSPALNAGDSTACLPFDQRQAPRPQGVGCDLGAVEVETALNSGNAVAQLSLSTGYGAIPQPCATVAEPGLPRHTITPTLQSNAGVTYRDLYFVVTELTYTTAQGDNTPILCNADGLAYGLTGGIGAKMTVVQQGTLADNRLVPNESFAPAFVVGLPIRARYRLFVNLYGAVTASNMTMAAHQAEQHQWLGQLGWEFDKTGTLLETSRHFFLPLVLR